VRVMVKLSPEAEAVWIFMSVVCVVEHGKTLQLVLPRRFEVKLTGQLLHRRLALLSLLEEDGATAVTAGVAEGEGLALDDIEFEVGKGRLSQGHGGQSRGGNNGVLHVCGSG
jgi:hypothetical protein